MTEVADLRPEALPAGPDGVLLRFGLRPTPSAITAAQELARQVEAAPPAGVVEIAPALVSVLLRFDPALGDRAAIAREMLDRANRIAGARARRQDPARRWTIPAAFGDRHGPQLAELAARIGLSETAAVKEICEADLRVLTIGFAPGQPYIGLLPELWDIPRLDELTPSVPAGAVVVAVRQIVMFGAPSATGWRQVARAGFRSFRPDRDDPMPLRTGDAIRFAPASGGEIESLSKAPDGLGGATLEVLR